MNGRRFDLLSRWLVTGHSRRTTLRALAAGALTAGLGGLVPHDAAAKCVKLGKTCKKKNGKKQKCCGEAKCQGKKCRCLAGKQPCGQTCCQASQVCAGGQCVIGAGTCPTDGADSCNGQFTEPCNDNPACVCYTTPANATRCGLKQVLSLCGICTSDADCSVYDAGAFCAKDTGALCCGFPNDGMGFCTNPCPS